ncbi:hypothetical protein JXO59_03695, partial [candidate division KSB1 bacterium]|nr:hypothetical protein [candidate division KSB1 bacterium]
MKSIKIGIFVSVLLHFGIFIFCYYFYLPMDEYQPAEVTFLYELESASPQPAKPAQPERARRIREDLSVRDKRPVPEAKTTDESLITTEPTHPSLHDSTKTLYFMPESYSLFWLQPDSLHPTATDSLRRFVEHRFSSIPHTGPVGTFDRIGHEQYQRNLGHPPLLP